MGVVLLGLGPLWNQQTLGGWSRDPYPLYSRTYFPFDKPGFGIDAAPPLRPLPPELRSMDAWSRELHAAYVPSAMPVAFAQRVLGVVSWYALGWRLALAALLIGALLRARGAGRFAAVSSLSLFVAYLAFAHPPSWVVYYVELLPGLHFLAAVNLVRLLGGSKEGVPRDGSQMPAIAARASAVAAVLVALFCLSDLPLVRGAIDRRNGFHRRAADVVRAAPPNSILFVRYPADHDPHLAITRNEADLSTAASWIVYDRGAENARLLAVAPTRQPYLLDVATFRLEPLATAPE
jgi:hypothetical protein